MNFLASFIRIAIFIGILYLIFTNFGVFLAIIGGIVLFFITIIYFVKRALRKRAQQFQFEFNSYSIRNEVPSPSRSLIVLQEKITIILILKTSTTLTIKIFKETSILKLQNFKKQKSFLVFQQLHQKMI